MTASSILLGGLALAALGPSAMAEQASRERTLSICGLVSASWSMTGRVPRARSRKFRAPG